MLKRIDTLDYLRGFALVGIIFINIYQMVPYFFDPSATDLLSIMDRNIRTFINNAVYQRFYTIFSFLFGIGFYLFITRARARGEKANILFVRRLIVLFVIGFIHHQFQPGEALVLYSILGFLLLPLYRLKSRVNFGIAIVLWIPALWLGAIGSTIVMFILGLAVGQSRVFENIHQHKKIFRIMQVLSLLLIPLALWAQEQIISHTGYVDIGMTVGGLVIDVFYVTTLTLLLERTSVQKWLMPLNKLGRMALTNYLMQTVIILSLNAVFDLENNVFYMTLASIAAGILIFQIVLSSIWLKKFMMGPMELLWRIGTYGKIPDQYKRTSKV
ncbi:DUF418 domain-containing protein [Paenibacillus sp. N3/727]|uniref:DUF418 domain-containing protein n=1 Tax=Paenibacillus sp. N3/727 TaxID=2925845 RepID=UPI001F52F6EB|nr:DUF418 domain-containing protein [Paenibacillus sp. N3/727]UNK16478.1 DUF418 domain-containing protein [Paenibacillus sp. N3/727]